ncbi:hypothetical protein B0H11DRAFT_1113706 [Mycena galericulata]|nr:hypothetical protein B0H11DRAFT_1113706 [Mycena galericulata]
MTSPHNTPVTVRSASSYRSSGESSGGPHVSTHRIPPVHFVEVTGIPDLGVPLDIHRCKGVGPRRRCPCLAPPMRKGQALNPTRMVSMRPGTHQTLARDMRLRLELALDMALLRRLMATIRDLAPGRPSDPTSKISLLLALLCPPLHSSSSVLSSNIPACSVPFLLFFFCFTTHPRSCLPCSSVRHCSSSLHDPSLILYASLLPACPVSFNFQTILV